MRTERFDILIIGAGPAGIAAACAASQGSESGENYRIGVVDDNPAAGGQIWRGQAASEASTPIPYTANKWLERFRWSRTTTLNSTTILAAPLPNTLLAQDLSGPIELHYNRLILATGARERFLPFPGWTSPRIFGAGGLQALVKSGLPIANKKVIIAGSGPLLLGVAAHLKKYGAQILLITEQVSWEQLAPFAASVLVSPRKLLQTLQLKLQLTGIPFRTNTWPVRAVDLSHSLRVTLQSPAGPTEIDCDYLACGFFLIPNLELPSLLGCEIAPEQSGISVDAFQQTSITSIYAAGEATGIGGLEKSLIEGQIAGHATAGNPAAARALFRSRNRSHRFAAALRQAFAVRDELKYLADDQTIICRCEDIPLGALKPFPTARQAKLQTRCGMGPCQGRICGPACEFLFDWRDQSIRPPIFPAKLSDLA
jgi:NADPH-dependent 2,4-dienoyl-CoA reductase/sulfur reductase-like enzyme